MNLSANRLILLDTSVVVHLARNDATGKEIERRHGLSQRPERPLISTIAIGEIWGLAQHNGWGAGKMGALQGLLSELVPVDAGLPEITRQYAELYCFCRKNGISCGQNDLWIAATAKVVNAVLFTCDKDFDPLTGLISRVFVPEITKTK